MPTGVEEVARHTRRSRLRGLWRRLPRSVRLALRGAVALAIAGVVAAGVPFTWVQVRAHGHVYDAADPQLPVAEVAIVLGAQIAPGGTRPMPFLQGRLDTAAELLASGHVKVILVSGDAGGASGDEPEVMRDYLIAAGVEPGLVMTDPYGLDTYASCVRARQVYGVARALVVTQGYHVARAVTLCRQAGIDADGVAARCDGCRPWTLASNGLREYFACTKAAWEAWRDPPAPTTR